MHLFFFFFVARNLAEAEALRTGIIKLNTAFSCFAANIPALVTPSLHRTQPPPFAYGTPTAQQGYGAVVNTACAAYVVLIKMYRAIELLLERDFLQADGFDRETRKKRWMTARAIAVLARQLSMELQWPDGARRLTEVHNPVLAVSFSREICVGVVTLDAWLLWTQLTVRPLLSHRPSLPDRTVG